MVDAISDYEVIRLDPDGIICSWNPGAERLTQYSPHEAVGQHVSMLYTQEDASTGLAGREMSAAVRDGRCETEGWRIRRDGSRFWVNVTISPIRDTTGELIGFVKVARDLTDQREQGSWPGGSATRSSSCPHR
jgi:PAS domain S-box-containing protein